MGFEDVYAAGDACLCESEPQPQLAQPAIQMGVLAARNIIADAGGQARQEFAYHDKGTMATIGRYAAVVQFPKGPKLTGFVAWILWVVVHLMTLLGGRNRVSAMINLAVRYFAWPKSAAGIVGDFVESPARMSRGHAADD